MEDFDYFEPLTLAEASRTLARYKGKARVLAGGTDLIPRMRRKLVKAKALVNLKRVPGLKDIKYKKGTGLTIGPLVTFTELIENRTVAKRFPVLIETFQKIATPQVRNIATLAGNICNAAPSADSAPILMAMDARATIYSPGGKTRKMPLEDLFTGPGSIACKPGEVLRAVTVPDIKPNTGLSYFKHKTREALEIAVVGVAAMLRLEGKKSVVCKDARIIVGACAPVPLRIPKAEAELIGRPITSGTMSKAARAAAEGIRPITDVRGSMEYRRDMTEVRTLEALTLALVKVITTGVPGVSK
jgi:carbon-monoxide dehydrogenase medium subunit